MDKLWYNPEKVRTRKDGKIEQYCEACKSWKTGLFYKGPGAWYWRCQSCKENGWFRRQK